MKIIFITFNERIVKYYNSSVAQSNYMIEALRDTNNCKM